LPPSWLDRLFYSEASNFESAQIERMHKIQIYTGQLKLFSLTECKEENGVI